MIKKYLSEVVEVKHYTENIYSLSFKSLGRKFRYKPGQFFHLAIDDYDGIGQWPESRCFSMQSSPQEELLRITYSVKGRFTQRMTNELTLGKKVWLKMPYGSLFEVEHDKTKTIFIAGGTGITPFLSLFCDNSFSNYFGPTLFFGVRDIKYHLYKKELEESVKNNNKLSVFLYVDSLNGRPGIDQILKIHGRLASFFISGPPDMIKFYKNSLIDEGVDNDNIFTDDWG